MWSVWNGVDEIFSNKGIGEEKERIYIRGLGNSYLTSGVNATVEKRRQSRFDLTGSSIEIHGKLNSLFNYSTLEKENLIASSGAHSLFMNNDSIKVAGIRFKSQIKVDQTYRYVELFASCHNLEEGPYAIVTNNGTLGQGDCLRMFQNCTKLKKAPYIYTSWNKQEALYNAFDGCTSLNAIPQLYDVHIYDNSMSGMFRNCSSIGFSKTQTEKYKNKYSIVGDNCAGSAHGLWEMFSGTSGPVNGNGEYQTTYYTDAEVLVKDDLIIYP